MVKLELLAQPVRGYGEKNEGGEVEHREADEDDPDDVGSARDGSSTPLGERNPRGLGGFSKCTTIRFRPQPRFPQNAHSASLSSRRVGRGLRGGSPTPAPP